MNMLILTHFWRILTHFLRIFRLLVVVCLAAYAAGQGFRKKTSGPTTPATVQKQVAAGVSLFTFLNQRWNSQKFWAHKSRHCTEAGGSRGEFVYISKPEVEFTRVLGPQWHWGRVLLVVYISLNQRCNSQDFWAHNSRHCTEAGGRGGEFFCLFTFLNQ